MKKTIIIVCVFTVFLMLMIPNIISVETHVVTDEDKDKEGLKSLIIDRIKELKEEQKKITLKGINFTDPDGPLEGGLDDYTDFYFLFLGFWLILYLPYGKHVR